MRTNNDYEITRINGDINGNPRYVVHFMAFVQDLAYNYDISISEKYSMARARTKKYGGKKYHNKQYGGGIVFSSYSPEIEINKIINEIGGNNAN